MRYTAFIAFILILFCMMISLSHAANLKCEKCIEESQKYIHEAEVEAIAAGNINVENQKQFFLKAISAFISATEYYLNNCTDSQKILTIQPDLISKLLGLLSQNCTKNKSDIQLIDIDKDNNNEVILHSVLSCNAYDIYDRGFSLVFFRNSLTKEWKGITLWPVELLENTQLAKPISSRHANSAYECLTGPQFKPNIFMLDLKDEKGRTYMAIESMFEGGNYANHDLSIIRWEGMIPEEILVLSMRDWCEQPYWIIEKDCCKIIPEAKATERCPEREKHTFFLENDFEKGKIDFVY